MIKIIKVKNRRNQNQNLLSRQKIKAKKSIFYKIKKVYQTKIKNVKKRINFLTFLKIKSTSIKRMKLKFKIQMKEKRI